MLENIRNKNRKDFYKSMKYGSDAINFYTGMREEVKSRRENISIARNTAVTFCGQTTQLSSSLSPKRDN